MQPDDLRLKNKEFNADTVEKEFTEILDKFELDLLASDPEQLKNLKVLIIPALMRGRIVVDYEHIKITYSFKKPIKMIGKNNTEDVEIFEIVFSPDNCVFSEVVKMESNAKSGNFAPIVMKFAPAQYNNSLLTEDMLKKKLIPSDYATCGALATLFLAF